MLDSSIFRAYDIRGIYGKTINEETMFLIGKGLGSLAKEKEDQQIVLARDGRISSPALMKALSHGILATGCDVFEIGQVPTPLLYYATTLFDGHSGVMVTGSHNPKEYNGLKIVLHGETLAENKLQQLHHYLQANKFCQGEGAQQELNIVDRYINHVTRTVHIKRPLKVVIDAGNGVTGEIAPLLFKELGCEVIELFCDVDGLFPNHQPDPSQPENLAFLIQAVKKQKADIGLAFDGDGDRLGVVTRLGEIIWPDRLLMLFAKQILSESPSATIIYDVKCTGHLDTLIRSLGGEPLMWKTGHSLIKAKLFETKAKLAGEMSGHFFFRDRWYGFDDGLYAGARLLEILSQQATHDDPFAAIPNSVNTPELKVSVMEEEKFELMNQLRAKADFQEAQEVMTLDGVRVNFSDGWGLVRASNTAPYLILRFEAMNQAILENIQTLFKNWLLSVKADLILPF